MRISDWSSDVCSSDLIDFGTRGDQDQLRGATAVLQHVAAARDVGHLRIAARLVGKPLAREHQAARPVPALDRGAPAHRRLDRVAGTPDIVVRDMAQRRSEEHTSELQSLMRNSYAVFCLKKKKQRT